MSNLIEESHARGIERLGVKQIEYWIKHPAKGAATMKLSDGGGLYLVRLPSGAATWRVKYRLGGIEKSFTIGTASTTSLSDARAERRRIKVLIKEGVDPVQARRVDRAVKIASSGNLFNDAAAAWLQKEKAGWSAIHYKKSKQALERHVLPWLGALPVKDITPAMCSAVIKRIQARGKRETAGKVLQHVRAIFRLAAAEGLRDDNPSDACVEVLSKTPDVTHHAAFVTFPELGDVLRRAEAAPITPAVRLAHKLLAFTGVRIGNAVAARWADFDLKAKPALWVIPRPMMKVRGRAHDHKVILPETIADELRDWQRQAGRGAFVFPGAQGGAYLSREAVEKMVRVTLGLAGKHSPHGWRASFSTLAKESGHFDNQVVDLALDHIHDTAVARAYDRGPRLVQRVKLMKWWGEQLDTAQGHTSKVVQLKRGAA